MASTSEWALLARLGRPRGNRGELTAENFTSGPERFQNIPSVELFSASGEHHGNYCVERAWDHQGSLILKFAGVDSISAAEQLRGMEVRIRASERAPLGEGEYYLSDLMGATVFDAVTGETIGKVVSWEDSGGVHLLEVEGDVLIPFKREFLEVIDPDRGVIRARLPEGLRDLNRS